MRILRLLRFVLILLPLVTAPASFAQGPAEEPGNFLRKHAAFTPAEFGTLEGGQPVSKILDSKSGTEVAPLGVGRVAVPLDFFLDKYRDIANFKKAPEVLQIAKFHTPPVLADLDGLTLERSEIESLRKCRVGDCALKMSAEMIEGLQKGVNWGAQDYEAQVNRVYRQELLDYVRGYLVAGNARLVVYHDKKRPAQLADECASIVTASPYLAEYVPAFRAHLLEFPSPGLQDSEDFLYWSKERFGYKPVVSISHVTIHRLTRAGHNAAVIASKQIYASHYLSASLGLSAFVETGSPAGAYLVYLNRSRTDLLQGMFSGVIRFFLRRRVLDGLDKYQRLTKEKLERAYRG